MIKQMYGKQMYGTSSDWSSPENIGGININSFLLRVFKCDFCGHPLDLSFLFLQAVWKSDHMCIMYTFPREVQGTQLEFV